MKSHNLTPFVRGVLIIGWIVGAAGGTAALLPAIAAIPFGVFLGVSGSWAIYWFLDGDRLWITNHSTLPFTLMWKPRGYSMSSALGGHSGSDDGMTRCDSCDDKFEIAQDHFRSDANNYCPDCSRVGEVVMNNYQEWFESTDEVRQAAD